MFLHMQAGILLLLLSTDAIPVQVVPEGIQSINGSNLTMGCTSSLEEEGDVMVCRSESNLVGGCSANIINTSATNWASQLVTVQQFTGSADIPFAHVLLIFGFNTSVSFAGIEMDLFHCPDWNIGAPKVTVYVNEEYDFKYNRSLPFTSTISPPSSCDSLSTLTLTGDAFTSASYQTIHILVDFTVEPQIQWVHFGKVRFISMDLEPDGTCIESSGDSLVEIKPQTNSASQAMTFFPSPSPSSIFLRKASPSLGSKFLKKANTQVSTTLLVSSTLPHVHSTAETPTTEKMTPVVFLSLLGAIIALSLLALTLVSMISLCSVKLFSYSRKTQNRASNKKGNRETEGNSSGDRELREMVSLEGPNHQEKSFGVYHQPLELSIPTVTVSSGIYSVIRTGKSTANPAGTSSAELTQPPQEFDQINDSHQQPPPFSCPANGSNSDKCEQIYSDPHVRRKVPTVPAKSSDLLEYLDTEPLNMGIYSEPINHLDFSRNRLDDSDNEPMFLPPVYPKVSDSYDPTEVSSEDIIEEIKLGSGNYGEVVVAKTEGLMSITVLLKKLDPNSSQEAFEKEANFMSQVKHPNILCLLGVCRGHSTFIMMEYTDGGDLNQFLQHYTEISEGSSSETQITASELVHMATQIARGMEYLANLKSVHRDLATRNCLVEANGLIKVGAVGVNSELYQSSYYQIRGNKMMPIRWMSTECFSGKFLEKSDVWAFGVTLWELFTLAKQLPYPHLSDDEVVHNALKREYRQFPAKPVVCPQSVYETMDRCWAVDMRQRATFQEIVTLLQ